MIAKTIPSRAGTRTFATGIRYIEKHEHRVQLALVGSGISFEDRVSYASAPEKAAWVHVRGVSSVATAAIEMEAVAGLSRRCADPVQHEIIAYAKYERPTREQIVADAERLLTALDMEDHQYVLSVHTDTDDLHAHIIANRVGPDGLANVRWQDRPTRERVCAEIAAERGWNIVVGFHNRDLVQEQRGLDALPPEPQRRNFDRDFSRVYERGELPWQDAARPYVLDAVERATSWDDLRTRLDGHGIVLKAVQRGGRFQGLAFAEGFAPDAPGCGASKIDVRCKLSALEARFGPYAAPEHAPRSVSDLLERGKEKPLLWRDRMRPVIVAAVDAAQSWDDLRLRLSEVNVVLKPVQRGARFQGLAFAASLAPDAPGCGASKIDARCKLSALEARFGVYQADSVHQMPTERDAGDEWTVSAAELVRAEQALGVEGLDDVAAVHDAEEVSDPTEAGGQPNDEQIGQERPESVRERVERDSAQGAAWAFEQAQSIADNARLREAYQQFRDRFYQERRAEWIGRRDAAWNAECAQRRAESEGRWQAKQALRAVARTLTPSGGVRRVAYAVVEKLHALHTNLDRARASDRWERTKAELGHRVEQERAAKSVRYRDFVAERAREGDAGARRVLAYLDRRGASDGMQGETKTIERGGGFVGALAAAERALLERSAAVEQERRETAAIREPEPLERQIERAREAVVGAARAQAMEWSAQEQQRLEAIERKHRHWNPLVRVGAVSEERELLARRENRVAKAVDGAEWAFRQREISRLTTAYQEQRRAWREGRERLVRLDEEQRGIGRDLRELEAMRKELETNARVGVKLSRLDVADLPEEPRERFRAVRAAFEKAQARFFGHGRSTDAVEHDVGVELEY